MLQRNLLPYIPHFKEQYFRYRDERTQMYILELFCSAEHRTEYKNNDYHRTRNRTEHGTEQNTEQNRTRNRTEHQTILELEHN